jgi:hypothetical protein
MSSAITGALEQVRQRQSSIGQPYGATGSGRSVTVNEPEARDWLLAQIGPEAVDAALCRSLTSTFGATVRLHSEGRYPEDKPAYRVITGCSIWVPDSQDTEAVRAAIDAAMTPPTKDQTEGWLVMLQAVCARRSDSEALQAVAYELYAGALCGFPADVARSACERLARGTPGQTVWFPTFGELMDECESLCETRHAMRAATIMQRDKAAPDLRRLPPRAPQVSKADRVLAAEDFKALARSFTGPKLPARPKRQFCGNPPKLDAAGITPQMRAWLEQRAEQ